MTIKNRDAQSPSNLSLDTLQAHEIERYRSGQWLTSAELRGPHPDTSDTELMAELSARLLISAESLTPVTQEA